jgi:hypothetical protein
VINIRVALRAKSQTSLLIRLTCDKQIKRRDAPL